MGEDSAFAGGARETPGRLRVGVQRQAVRIGSSGSAPNGRSAVSLFLDEDHQRFGQNSIVLHGLAGSL